MSVLNPVQAETLAQMDEIQVSERTERQALSMEEMRTHFLLPGEICVCLDDPNLSTDAVVGVVVLSAEENPHTVEVLFGREPIKRFSRQRLLWAGPIG